MKTKVIFLFFFFSCLLFGQNVIIVVIDGARYTESFGRKDKFIPHLYNELKPQGTIFTNFRIADEGYTTTNPGHASIITGTWQLIKNDGTERPNKPTIFEYFRKELSAKETDCFVVAGKKKIAALSYSAFPGFGEDFGASTCCFDGDDNRVYDSLVVVMDTYHPKIILVNFPTTDKKGHTGVWNDYINALSNADNLVYELWQKIHSDSFYKEKTTMLVTNDHGRHTDSFKNHGDDCDGCEHIMLLAIGRDIPEEKINSELHHQIDIAKTAGNLLGFETPYVNGENLFSSDSLNH